jgi:hypothetical protein
MFNVVKGVQVPHVPNGQISKKSLQISNTKKLGVIDLHEAFSAPQNAQFCS